MSSPLLSGHVQEYVRDDSPTLRREIERLVGELRRTEGALQEAQSEARMQTAAITSLRRQLSPLYRALQGVFGELENFSETPDTASSSPSLDDRKREIWGVWKEKLGNACGRIIDALLVHGTMSRTQICIATGISGGNIARPISKLYTANLLNKDGNSYSLKQL